MALSVGRRKSTVSTSGRSSPSLNRSAANRMLTRLETQVLKRGISVGAGCLTAHAAGRDPRLVEDVGHVVGMGPPDAEAQCPHRADVPDLVAKLSSDDRERGHRCLCRRLLDCGVVVAAPRPGDASSQCHPQRRSSGTGTAGPPRARPRGGARRRYRRRRRSERRCRRCVLVSLSGRAIRQAPGDREPPVRPRLRVVELVDNHDLEAIGGMFRPTRMPRATGRSRRRAATAPASPPTYSSPKSPAPSTSR